jgi:hypothetical protein
LADSASWAAQGRVDVRVTHDVAAAAGGDLKQRSLILQFISLKFYVVFFYSIKRKEIEQKRLLVRF